MHSVEETSLPVRTAGSRRRTHSIRFTVMTGFVGLLLLTAVPIIGYTHARSTGALMRLADELMRRASEAIIERAADYLEPAAAMVRMNARLAEPGPLSLCPGGELEARAIAVLQQYPSLAMVNMADEKGNFLMPKKMPDGTIATKWIDREANPPHTTWLYRDQRGVVVKTERSETVDYDPRTRPWYAGARSAAGVQWTDMYVFFTDQVPGVTASCRVRDSRNEPAGVFGIDIELGSMSRFLDTLTVGKQGVAFILNGRNELVAYPDVARVVRESDGKLVSARADEIGVPQVARCVEEYRTQARTRFAFAVDGTTYIGSITRFPDSFGNDWRIGMVVPRDEFIGTLRNTARYTLCVALAILAAALVVASSLARAISRPVTALAAEARAIQDLRFGGSMDPGSRIREIRELQTALANTQTALAAFGKYVPGELVRQLVRRGEAARIGGHRAELTVFFSDIQGFTPIAESLPPESLVSHLSEYLERVTGVIAAHNGTVDKFIGDAVMAFWGAPVPEADHAGQACLAALGCQEQVRRLNAKWVAEGKAVLPTRIGIHTGDVVVGNVGSAERMNYSVLGDAVNVASRLEGAGKVYGVGTIVGETTYLATADRLVYRPLDRVAVLGRRQGVMIYELLGCRGGELPEGTLRLCEGFAAALDRYFRRDWQEALALFSALGAAFPQDRPTALFVERCRALLADPPGDEWDAITRLDTK